jgi:hypothetical protein
MGPMAKSKAARSANRVRGKAVVTAQDRDLVPTLKSIETYLATIASHLAQLTKARSAHRVASGGRVPDIHAAARSEVRRGGSVPALHASHAKM